MRVVGRNNKVIVCPHFQRMQRYLVAPAAYGDVRSTVLGVTGQVQVVLTGPILHHIGLRSVGYEGHCPLDGGTEDLNVSD